MVLAHTILKVMEPVGTQMTWPRCHPSAFGQDVHPAFGGSHLIVESKIKS